MPLFPPDVNFETPTVMRALIEAHRNLAELKGVARSIPNETILISTLALQEAQSSSEIENIVTTQDALYRYQIHADERDGVTKEVAHYADGLAIGFSEVKTRGLLTLRTILNIQAVLEGNNAGFRTSPGTVLQNRTSGEVLYTPPSPELVPDLMKQLERFIHTDSSLDSLIRMALIHHQFESIHPFYDGNGRTGRIINILFLVREGLLDTPILYLSRYINQTRSEYYRLLQSVRNEGCWEAWLLYMLRGVSTTARHTLELIEQIDLLLMRHKNRIRSNHKFYSQDLLNNIFHHPYTKVAFLENDLKVSRATATRYLDALAIDGILLKQKLGRENYYINQELVDLLFNLPDIELASS